MSLARLVNDYVLLAETLQANLDALRAAQRKIQVSSDMLKEAASQLARIMDDATIVYTSPSGRMKMISKEVYSFPMLRGTYLTLPITVREAITTETFEERRLSEQADTTDGEGSQ